MASGASDLESLAPRRWARNWHEYENYQLVHDRHMSDLIAEGLVVRETLRFLESVDATDTVVRVNLKGRIQTRAGGVLVVNKWLEVRHGGRTEVRTEEYAYHAFTRRPAPRRDLFRYDNCHGGLETLHRHRYDQDGREVTPPVPVAHDALPTLDLVIRETDWRVHEGWAH